MIKINTKKIFIIIILISSSSIIYRLVNYLYIHNHQDHHIFENRLYYIFFIPLFSKYILKENIYRHQYFSLIFFILGIIFLIIPVCLVFEKDDILPNILNLIISSFYPLNLVLIKYLYEIYYISPFKTILLISVFLIISISLYFFIYSLNIMI